MLSHKWCQFLALSRWAGSLTGLLKVWMIWQQQQQGAAYGLRRPPHVPLSEFVSQAVAAWAEESNEDCRRACVKREWERRKETARIRYLALPAPPPGVDEPLVSYEVRQQQRRNVMQAAIDNASRSQIGFSALKTMIEQTARVEAPLILAAFEKANEGLFALKCSRRSRTLLAICIEFRAVEHDLIAFAVEKTPVEAMVAGDVAGNNVLHVCCTHIPRIVGGRAPLLSTLIHKVRAESPQALQPMLMQYNRLRRTPILEAADGCSSHPEAERCFLELVRHATAEALFTKADKKGKLPLLYLSSRMSGEVLRELKTLMLNHLEDNPNLVSFHVPPVPKPSKGRATPSALLVYLPPVSNSVFLLSANQQGAALLASDVCVAEHFPRLFHSYAFDTSWRSLGTKDLVLRLVGDEGMHQGNGPMHQRILRSFFLGCAAAGCGEEFLLRERSMSGITLVDQALLTPYGQWGTDSSPIVHLLWVAAEIDANALLNNGNPVGMRKTIVDRIFFANCAVNGCYCNELTGATPFAHWLRFHPFTFSIFNELLCQLHNVYGSAAHEKMATAMLVVPDEHSRTALQGTDLHTSSWCVGALIPGLLAERGIGDGWPLPESSVPFESGRISPLCSLGVRVDIVIKLCEIISRTMSTNPSDDGYRFSMLSLKPGFYSSMLTSVRRWATFAQQAGHRAKHVSDWLDVVESRFVGSRSIHGSQATPLGVLQGRIGALVQHNKPWLVRENAEVNLRKLLMSSGNTDPECISLTRAREGIERRGRSSLRAPNANLHLYKQLYAFLLRVKAWRHWRKVKSFVLARSIAFYWEEATNRAAWAPPSRDGEEGGVEFEREKADFEAMQI